MDTIVLHSCNSVKISFLSAKIKCFVLAGTHLMTNDIASPATASHWIFKSKTEILQKKG